MVTGVANKIRKSDGTLIINAYSEGMTYDLAGNLLTMQRNAIVNYTTNAVAQIDNLTYVPGASPSKLLRLLDVAAGSNQTRGYKPAATQFAYDNAGNITADAGKNIGIIYNPIHLPQRFTTTDGNIEIHYTYGGERGRKAIRNGFSTKRNEDSFVLHAKAYRSLKSFDDRRKSFSGKKIYTVDKRSQPIPIGGHLPIQRWYIGALELENGFRKVHHHPEGRISVDSITNDTIFEYSMQDHLGNTVVTFSDLNKNHSVNSSEVLQRNYYYAFGLQIDGNWDKVSNPVKNNYLYNGKELHDWNGLNWQDFNMRYYMPEIGRFTGVDPIVKDYPHVTPYNYAENDPIGHIDLWGLQKARPAIPVVPKPASKTNPFAGATYKGPQPSIGPAPDKSSPSFLQRLDNLKSKMPEGTSNNFNTDLKGVYFKNGIEIVSTEKLPGQGTTPTANGTSYLTLLNSEIYSPADAGGIAGDAANGLNAITKFLNNVGYGASVGKDAIDKISSTEAPRSRDTTVRNEKSGSYHVYDKEELNKRGRYKENKQKTSKP